MWLQFGTVTKRQGCSYPRSKSGVDQPSLQFTVVFKKTKQWTHNCPLTVSQESTPICSYKVCRVFLENVGYLLCIRSDLLAGWLDHLASSKQYAFQSIFQSLSFWGSWFVTRKHQTNFNCTNWNSPGCDWIPSENKESRSGPGFVLSDERQQMTLAHVWISPLGVTNPNMLP